MLSKPTTRMLVALALIGALDAPVVHSNEVSEHVGYLASEELEGRLTGTPGARKAADYIAKQLQEMGATPLPGSDGFLQPFEFTAGMNDGGSTLSLLLESDATEQRFTGVERVQALAFSDSDEVSGEVVFAGYGLTLPESQELGYDSYIGVDVKDKIVLILRYFPEDVDQEMRVQLARYSGPRYKAMRARELGARAILFLTGPRSPNAGETMPMTFDTALAGSGIVAASVAGEVGQALFTQAGRELEEVQAELDTGNPHVAGFDIPGVTLNVATVVERERKEGHNVVGLFPAGEAKREGYIVLGAHYDHLGRGRNGNSLAREGEVGNVHHGADDNASGVAVVLEVARRVAEKPRDRPVLVGFWAGEELGLLGSTAFVDAEPVPSDGLIAYINFDMVGRMRDERLSLQATGSSSVWPRLVEQTNVVVGLDVRPQEDPYLPTDSSAFYQYGVPSINFFTGSHDDYHRPTDTTETLNYDGMTRIVQFADLLVTKLAGLDQRPDYATVARKTESGGSRDTVRAFTGTLPDYTAEVEGLMLGGVIEGGPAEEAGLRGGDVIVEFAGLTIANIYDYTYALDAVKIDVPVKVVYLRDGERHETEVVPRTRE